MHIWGHFKTITYHKLLVMKYCFRVGLIRQGMMHDWSKYSWSEFRTGIKYYAGTRSPNAVERDLFGYSYAWLHHKGRNRHHLEFWIDYGTGSNGSTLQGNEMPVRYMLELCCDRIAASKVYHGDSYTDRDALDYLLTGKDSSMMHPVTKRQVTKIFLLLAEQGEDAAFRFMHQVLKHPELLDDCRMAAGESDIPAKDSCFISDDEIKAIAGKISTPFYLYDENGIRQSCLALAKAFSWNKRFRQFYPLKACPTAGILKILKSEGQGIVCSAASELELCRRCGFEAKDVLFLPNYPTELDLKAAADFGCQIILDSAEMIEDCAAYGLLRDTVGIRIKPENYFIFGYDAVDVRDVKFAVQDTFLPEMVKKLKNYGVKKIGLHAYLNGNTLSEAYYPAIAAYLADTALRLSNQIDIDYLNISGGIGIAYHPSDVMPDISEYAERIRTILTEKLPEKTSENIAVYTELGRWVTGPNAVLVSTVTGVKHNVRNYAGIDASAADLMRPMMYGAYHHLSVCGKSDAPLSAWDVVGPICENTDKFAVQRMLPELQKGDLVKIHDVGAHCHSMGYNYSGRLRCGEYLLQEDHTVKQLRRPENFEDYMAVQVMD